MSLTKINLNSSHHDIYQRPKASTSSVIQGSKKGHQKKNLYRSISQNKSLTKLGTPTLPQVSGGLNRPNLGRSKSSDMITRTGHRVGSLKRNNRSLTRLSTWSGLQPLTKTTLNLSMKRANNLGLGKSSSTSAVHIGGIKSSGKKERAILRLNEDNLESDEYEDVENATADGKEKEALDKIQQYNIDSGDASAENEQSKHNKAFGDTLVDLDSASDVKQTEHMGKLKIDESNNDNSVSDSVTEPSSHKNLYGGSLLLSQSTGLVKKVDPSIHTLKLDFTNNGDFFSNENSSHPDLGYNIPNGRTQLDINHDGSSGLSFKASPPRAILAASNKVAHPIITNSHSSQGNSYQPNKSIFSNLQRSNSQYLSAKNRAQEYAMRTAHNRISESGNSDTLESYLDLNPSSHNNTETRTQQRLWLQRENSLMDVVNSSASRSNFSNLSLNNLMFANNYSSQNIRNLASSHQMQRGNTNELSVNEPNTTENARSEERLHNRLNNDVSSSNVSINGLLKTHSTFQNPIQSRTEYERLNREYLNVRRNLNPVGENLNRMKTHYKDWEGIPTNKGAQSSPSYDHESSDSVNSFLEYSPRFNRNESEINGHLQRLWQDAITLTLSINPSHQRSLLHTPQHPSHLQTQRPKNPGEASDSYNGHSGLSTLRTHTPTTRAVKLAAQAQARAQTSQPVNLS